MDLRTLALFVLAATLLAAPAWPQAEAPADPDPIDPRARTEVTRMAEFIRGLDRYGIEVRLEWDAIQDSGLPLRFGSEQRIVVARPNRLLVEARSDAGRARRTWFQDGTLTSLDVDENLYTRSQVPESLGGMLDWAAERGAPPSPLLDFLYPDVEESFLPGIESGLYVGTSFVGGVACHHLAFRTARTDYQLWIRADGDPLPLFYLITSRAEAGRPTFSARFLRWELEPPLDVFEAELPEGAREIEQVPAPPEPSPDEETPR